MRFWSNDGRSKGIHRLFEYHFNDAVITADSAILVAADKGTVARVDEEGKWIQRLAHRKATFKLALSPDQSQVASVGEDGFLRIWSVSDGTGNHCMEGSSRTQYRCRMAGKRDHYWRYSRKSPKKTVEGELRFWRLDGSELREPIKAPYVPITRMAVSLRLYRPFRGKRDDHNV